MPWKGTGLAEEPGPAPALSLSSPWTTLPIREVLMAALHWHEDWCDSRCDDLGDRALKSVLCL